ncbi:MAG: hypothetical protein PHT15_08210, partial [Gallionellaceae bacterium]|nr:hypothetical protein [Gallionellaceae bacterium]
LTDCVGNSARGIPAAARTMKYRENRNLNFPQLSVGWYDGGLILRYPNCCYCLLMANNKDHWIDLCPNSLKIT